MVDHNKIQEIFICYRDAMRSIANRKVTWPDAKDIKHTYLYMWLNKYVSWAERNNLDDETSCKVIYALVRYGKKQKILFKGSAILQHERIYNIALQELETYSDYLDNIEYQIRKVNYELRAKCGNAKLDEYLIHKPAIGDLPNIVTLYQNGILSKLYIAVSKSCRKAINKLDKNVIDLVPSKMELLKLQQRVTSDESKASILIGIMGDDYLK